MAAVDRALSNDPAGVARALVVELGTAGLSPAVVCGRSGVRAGGLGLRRSVRELNTAPAAIDALALSARSLLTLSLPITIALGDAGLRPARRLERILRRLSRLLAADCLDLRLLALAIDAATLPEAAHLLSSRASLGDGPRYLLGCDAAGSAAGPGSPWSTLYRQRGRRRAPLPVYGATVRTRCPLLDDETGDVPVTEFALLAPANSAWLPLVLDLCRFSDRHGDVAVERLHAALGRGLRLADRLFDLLQWPDANQRADARSNRRIVVVLQGLGDLVQLRRADPSGIACLRDLDRLVAGLHTCLWEASRRLAAERGVLPALSERDPGRLLADREQRLRWRQRWQAALETTAVRHRNLLALSPCSLLPRNGAGDSAYGDLLPLLAHADVLAFAPGDTFPGWSITDFRAFHQRAAAIAERRNTAAFVATGV